MLLFLITACGGSSPPAPAPQTPVEAPAPAPDAPTAGSAGPQVVMTGQGPLTITPVQHATLVLSWDGKTVWVDPVKGAVEAAPSPPRPADLVLVTDLHGDHLDVEQIAALRKEGAPVIAPAASADGIPDVTVLANEEVAEPLDGITVEAIPMYNLKRTRPDNGEPFHVKGRGNGYVVHFGTTSVYISGDTECTPEMKALEDIDVALVCMNLPYTMPLEEAAECVEAFAPRIVFPYHHRGQDPEAFAKAVADVETDVRILDWYPQSDESTGE